MERFDLERAPLEGTSLIEASAGTGKTFTIAGLYLRLVQESRLPVESILVVTFTRAATAELRERLRARLAERRDALASASDPKSANAFKRVKLAVLSFDRAAIFTIHAFCQRALADSAFEGGFSFDSELLPDQQALLNEIADDFWRRRVQNLPPLALDHLLERGVSPESLLRQVRGGIGRPWLEVRGGEIPQGFDEQARRYEEAFRAAQALWRAEGGEIEQLFLRAEGLSGIKYKTDSRPGWLAELRGCLAGPPGPLFEKFEKFCTPALEAGVNKGKQPPRHPFFDACETLRQGRAVLDGMLQQLRVGLQRELLAWLAQELTVRKEREGVQSYDDLLLRLDAALQGPGGDRLAAALRGRYRAALIDEFQDTDQLQYRIFHRIFGEAGQPLFLVGDPKQAIYSFRGADIFAYLQAAQSAEARRATLVENWRSVPGLLDGVNALFGADRPFLFDSIPFQPAEPARKKRDPLRDGEGEDAAPFRLWFLDSVDELPKGKAEPLAVELVAREIARLLTQAADNGLSLGNRPLNGGDIAVLVRKHKQGAAVQARLRQLGIASVHTSQEKVFQSEEAEELERLLLAIADPGREGFVRAALATRLLGWDGMALWNLGSDERRLEEEIEAFRDWRRLWQGQGFMGMFRRLQTGRQLAPRLLSLPDGERRLTNLFHLAELLHREEHVAHHGLEGLIEWLAARRRGDASQTEEAELRLESDRNLVKIVTIHKSKGLEYPVVFVPFAWDGQIGSGSRNRENPYLFHEAPDLTGFENLSGLGAYRAVLELGSDRFEMDRPLAEREELAENLRLLYVALTRAKHRCYLLWGLVNQCGASPLGYLLHPPGDLDSFTLKSLQERLKGRGAEHLWARLEELAQAAAGVIRAERCAVEGDAAPFLGESKEGVEPAARSLGRTLRDPGRITSFTALAGGHDSGERPDYDALPSSDVTAGAAPGRDQGGQDRGHGPLLQEPPSERRFLDFPRGSGPGTCLHSIFEELDFSSYTPDDLAALVERNLRGSGIDTSWTPEVAGMVERVLDAELAEVNRSGGSSEMPSLRAMASPARHEVTGGGGVRLRDIDQAHRLTELEFCYPLDPLRAEPLRNLLRRHGYGDGVFAEALQRLRFADIQGYMKGFVDLIFAWQGRWYIADYKSNWLGDSPAAYSAPSLAAAVAAEQYHIQYLIYTLALHRYLRLRLRGYDYETHFGGIFYLFLRGMSLEAGLGVHRDRPSMELVDELDRLIGGGAA